MTTSRDPRGSRWALAALALGGALAVQTPVHAQSTQCLDPTIWENLEWAYLAYYPSEANPKGLPRSPLTKQFPVGPGGRDTSTERRIVLFGDLYPMQKDAPPIVHEDLREIFAGADLVVGNVESRIQYAQNIDVNRDQTGHFVSTTRFLQSVMAQYCMDPQKTVFNIANNHAGDLAEGHEHDADYTWSKSLEAVEELESWGTQVVGVGPEDQDTNHPHPLMRVHQMGGVRIGVVGWTQVVNAQDVECDWQPAYCLADAWATAAEVLAEDWQAIKVEHDIDLLIGSVHWQDQFRYFPEGQTIEDGHAYRDLGFDIIAGHGPSVLQPADDEYDGLFYSTGILNTNFAYLGTNKLVNVLELTVDAGGNPVEYTLHPFAQRRVYTKTLDSQVDCFDYWADDSSPQTRWARWEVLPLSEVPYFPRMELYDELETVYW